MLERLDHYSIFGTTCPNTNVALHTFDHTIKPILIYGSEISVIYKMAMHYIG